MTLSITSPDGKRYSTLEELSEFVKEYFPSNSIERKYISDIEFLLEVVSGLYSLRLIRSNEYCSLFWANRHSDTMILDSRFTVDVS